MDIDVYFSIKKNNTRTRYYDTSPWLEKACFTSNDNINGEKIYFLPNQNMYIMLLRWTTQLLFQCLLSSQCYSSFPSSSLNNILWHRIGADRTKSPHYSCPSTAVTDKFRRKHFHRASADFLKQQWINCFFTVFYCQEYLRGLKTRNRAGSSWKGNFAFATVFVWQIW